MGIAKGIGVTLYSTEEGVCGIESIIPGGVAQVEGSLQVGDIMTEVNGVPVRDTTMDEIHELLSGAAGSSVTICAARTMGEASEEEEVRAILFRAGVEVGGEDAHELCSDVTQAMEALRSTLASVKHSLEDVTLNHKQ